MSLKKVWHCTEKSPKNGKLIFMRDTATFPSASSETNSASSFFWTWPRAIAVSVVVLLVIVLGTALLLYSNWNRNGKIAPGLIVQGESLGGLTSEEAQAHLEERFGRLFINLETPNQSIKLILAFWR